MVGRLLRVRGVPVRGDGLKELRVRRIPGQGWVFTATAMGPDTTPHTGGNAPEEQTVEALCPDDGSGRDIAAALELCGALLSHVAGEEIPR